MVSIGITRPDLGDASLAGSIIDPICDEGSEGDDTTFNTNEEASVGSF